MKHLCMLLVAVATCWQLAAQPLGTKKVDTSGGFRDIIHLKNGGYITTGDDGYPLFKVVITKWDEDFNMVWSRKMSDNDLMQSPARIVEGTDGMLYFMSYHLNADYLVLKMDSVGEVHSLSSYTEQTSLNVFNPVHIGGFDKSLDGYGYVMGGGQCGHQNLVIRADSSGSPIWSKQYKLSGHSLYNDDFMPFCILPDEDGYICGFMNTDSAIDLNMFLLKIDDSGNVLKQQGYNNSVTHHAFMPLKIIHLKSSGNYAVLTTGEKAYSQFGVSVIGSAILIVDSNLAPVKYLDIHPYFEEFVLNDITSINNGTDIIATGYMDDSVQAKKVQVCVKDDGTWKWAYASDVYNGQTINYKVWAGNLASSNDNKVVSLSYGATHGKLVEMLDGQARGLCGKTPLNLVVNTPAIVTVSVPLDIQPGDTHQFHSFGSFSNSTIVPPPHTELCSDTLLTTGVAETGGNGGAMAHVYPVPAHDRFFISGLPEGRSVVSYRILALDGRMVKTGVMHVAGGQSSVDIRQLTEGIYVLSIESSEGLSNHRIQVVR